MFIDGKSRLKGLIYFNPNDITPLSPPQTVLTDFKVFGKMANGDSAISSGTHLPYTKEVFVSYDDNIITFTFAGLDYRKMNALRYRYKLLPFSKDWMRREKAHLLLCIKDDGIGFDSHQRYNGNGLQNMKNRAAAIHTIADIRSAPGQGSGML